MYKQQKHVSKVDMSGFSTSKNCVEAFQEKNLTEHNLLRIDQVKPTDIRWRDAGGFADHILSEYCDQHRIIDQSNADLF